MKASATIHMGLTHVLAEYLHDQIELIADNKDGEYSPEDEKAARELRYMLEDGEFCSFRVTVRFTPAIRAMLLTGWEGTDVLDAIANIAQHSWSEAEACKLKREIAWVRRKLA
jgi:hypothetical protein